VPNGNFSENSRMEEGGEAGKGRLLKKKAEVEEKASGEKRVSGIRHQVKGLCLS
jgi:hypothetical protein